MTLPWNEEEGWLWDYLLGSRNIIGGEVLNLSKELPCVAQDLGPLSNPSSLKAPTFDRSSIIATTLIVYGLRQDSWLFLKWATLGCFSFVQNLAYFWILYLFLLQEFHSCNILYFMCRSLNNLWLTKCEFSLFPYSTVLIEPSNSRPFTSEDNYIAPLS